MFKDPALAARFAAFVAESHPGSLERVTKAFAAVLRATKGNVGRKPLRAALRKALQSSIPRGAAETTPGVPMRERMRREEESILDACDGFVRREELRASLTTDERREILRGMILTRAADNRLKAFFTGGEVRYGNASFQGKGFRSLGQEAIYASAIRLKRGEAFRDDQGGWRGDVVAPLIRDAGVVIAMRPEPATIRLILNGQMGKAGPPTGGKDLHVGDFEHGVLPSSAPLTISTMTIAGMAMAFSLRGEDRVAVSYVGEGATSLGVVARGTRRSTCAPRASFPQFSACRTTRPRFRRRWRRNRPCARSPTRRPVTAFPGSRSMEPIPMPSRPRSRGRRSGPAKDSALRSSNCAR